jgi:Arm domain-containing DNA-binding protein
MNPTSFHSKTTPWRVQLSGRYSPDGKRKTKYFKTRDEAHEFCQSLKMKSQTEVRDRLIVDQVIDLLGQATSLMSRLSNSK